MPIRTHRIVRFWHSSSKQYTPSQIKQFVDQYGTNILIGGDPGWTSNDLETFNLAMQTAEQLGALKHKYLVGPGVLEWAPEERTEIENNAKFVGIDIKKSTWERQWYADRGGWYKFNEHKFKQCSDQGYYSAEIDNLDGVWEHSSDRYISFLKDFQKFRERENIETRLMIKNLQPYQLQAMIDDKSWERDMLAQFGIFEKGFGNHRQHIELCKQLDITAVTTDNGLSNPQIYTTTQAGIPAHFLKE